MGALLERFSGEENHARLVEAVAQQDIVANDIEIAKQIIAAGELKELSAGNVIIRQGDWDDDIFFILAGELQITINGRAQAVREAGAHVGELTGTAPARARTATVTALGEALVLYIKHSDMEEIAGNNAPILKRMIGVVTEHLDERNRGIGRTNEIPRVFVISSSEKLNVAEEIFRHLDSDKVAVQLWSQGTFGVSDYPISSLMDAIEEADFTIAVAGADDTLTMRNEVHQVARDNVHLEYGISLGVLGRRRSILLVCADDEVRLPSDVAGLNTLRYRNNSEDSFKRSIFKTCIDIKEHIVKEGVFTERRVR